MTCIKWPYGHKFGCKTIVKKDDFLEGLLFEIHLLHNYLVYRIYIVIFGFSEEFQI